MSLRFSGTPPNLALAFMLAPIAGAVAASVAAVIWFVAMPRHLGGFSILVPVVLTAGIYALAITVAFTVVAGSLLV